MKSFASTIIDKEIGMEAFMEAGRDSKTCRKWIGPCCRNGD
jgi:hypothetical protein